MSDTPSDPRMPIRDRAPFARRLWLLAAVLAIAILPLMFPDSYWRTNLIVCAINVMLAIGLDFVVGYAGQLNLGQSAFYGLGAYVSTLLIARLGVPFWAALAGGMLLAAADLVARTIASPRQLPVGAIMALVGAPLFVALLRGRAR